MLKQETGAVMRLEGGKAAVRIRSEPSEACAGCKACHARGGGDFLLWIDADDIKEGDQVTVEVPVPGPWRAILLVFALPLVFLMAGVLVGSAWTGFQKMTGLGRDGAAIVLGVGFMLVPLPAATIADRRFRHPHAIKVHRSGGPHRGDANH